MQTIKLKTHIGNDGILQLQMPPEVKDMDVEILVAFEPKAEEKKIKKSGSKGWQPGFFEEVIGGWQGEPLVREEQGEYEVREAFAKRPGGLLGLANDLTVVTHNVREFSRVVGLRIEDWEG